MANSLTLGSIFEINATVKFGHLGEEIEVAIDAELEEIAPALARCYPLVYSDASPQTGLRRMAGR